MILASTYTAPNLTFKLYNKWKGPRQIHKADSVRCYWLQELDGVEMAKQCAGDRPEQFFSCEELDEDPYCHHPHQVGRLFKSYSGTFLTLLACLDILGNIVARTLPLILRAILLYVRSLALCLISSCSSRITSSRCSALSKTSRGG